MHTPTGQRFQFLQGTNNMENKNYIEIGENGRIIGNHNIHPEMLDLNPQMNLMEGSADPATQYIKNGQITGRPIQQTKLTGLTLTDLPVPCAIFINGQSYECDSEAVELEFDQPTLYEISVESWPYQSWSTMYENQA